MKNEKKQVPVKSSHTILKKTWHLIEASVALGMLYSLFGCVINKLNFLVSGTTPLSTTSPEMMVPTLVPSLIEINIPIPYPLAEILLICVLMGALTYIVLKTVCSEEWVKEPVDVEECWEEITWNPFSWIKSLVCTVVEVLKWVLKQICKVVEILVTVLVISCIILGIILFLI